MKIKCFQPGKKTAILFSFFCLSLLANGQKDTNSQYSYIELVDFMKENKIDLDTIISFDIRTCEKNEVDFIKQLKNLKFIDFYTKFEVNKIKELLANKNKLAQVSFHSQFLESIIEPFDKTNLSSIQSLEIYVKDKTLIDLSEFKNLLYMNINITTKISDTIRIKSNSLESINLMANTKNDKMVLILETPNLEGLYLDVYYEIANYNPGNKGVKAEESKKMKNIKDLTIIDNYKRILAVDINYKLKKLKFVGSMNEIGILSVDMDINIENLKQFDYFNKIEVLEFKTLYSKGKIHPWEKVLGTVNKIKIGHEGEFYLLRDFSRLFKNKLIIE